MLKRLIILSGGGMLRGLAWRGFSRVSVDKPAAHFAAYPNMSQALNFATIEAVDRRRCYRDQVERLLERADYLEDADRLLVEQVYRHGMPVTDIARLTGDRPRNLQRRVAKLLKRLNSKLFLYVISHKDSLASSVRRSSELVVLHGHSLRRAASLSHRSLHQIRQDIRALRAMAGV